VGGDRMSCRDCKEDCNEDFSFNRNNESEFVLHECPEKMIKRGYWKFVDVFLSSVSLKQLPFSGGFMEQPFWFSDVWNILYPEYVKITGE
jgi:hypothetical protein